MMSESLRIFLYPFGLLANLFFTLRFIVQWFQSERKKESVIPRSFWILSLSANLIMVAHAFIQLQFPICLIQTLSGVIAWRNLNLMGSKPRTLRTTLCLMGGSALTITTLFILQGVLSHSHAWMRSPTLPWQESTNQPVSWIWHLFGLGGMVLFASRFWIQWWLAERKKQSVVGPSFWWISLCGASLSLSYFIKLNDFINVLSYSLALIPYIRNLALAKKKSSLTLLSPSLFIFAGEQSGDQLGAKLIQALKEKNPSQRIYGVGGPEMRTAGLECLIEMEQFQVMGVTDVLKALPRLFSHYRSLKKQILKDSPQGVILIDYADFNMHLAKALRKGGYRGKLIHYVCPSVWAWRKSRTKELEKRLDLLLSILPFEKEYFSKTSLNVAYIGHPLMRSIETHKEVADWKNKVGLSETKPLLALFPGSRTHAIEHNLPIQWKAIQPFLNDYTVAVSVARPDLLPLVMKEAPGAVYVPQHLRYELMQEAKGALATSGTINLELGLYGVPTVVTYKISQLNYFIGKYIAGLSRTKNPFFSLTNILSGKEIYPEFVDRKIQPEELTSALQKLLKDPAACQKASTHLRSILNKGDPNACAADAITEVLSLP